jgi:hypothetical protein
MRGKQEAKRKQITPHLNPLPRGERKKIEVGSLSPAGRGIQGEGVKK